MAVNLRQTHFRFGVDELAENTHGWVAAEDTNTSIPAGRIFLLRFTEQETGGTIAGNTDAVFQYNRNGAGWVDITTTSSVVKAVASVAFTNGQNCTQRLSGTGTFETTAAGCTEDGSSGGPSNDIAANGNSETECGLQVVPADVADADTIQFRFTSPDWTVGYDITPTLTVIKATLAADVGAFTLTGQDVVLARGYAIVADAGAYALSGQAADLLWAHVLPADAGSFSLTGQDVALSKGFLIVADSGSFALSGQDSALLWNRVVQTDPGSFSLAGQDSGLLWGHLVPADPASFALAGQDASLLWGHLVPADAGSFALAGQDTSLLWNRLIGAEAGAFTVAGQDAALLWGHLLAVEVGAFVLTGQDVVLTVGGGGGIVLVADPGAFSLAGQAVDLLRGYLVPAGVGAFILAGQDAYLVRWVPPLELTGAFDGFASAAAALETSPAATGAFSGFAGGEAVLE